MSDHADLLIEIGTEELPSSELKKLGRAFAELIDTALAGAGLYHGRVHSFATPRRLGVQVEAVPGEQPGETVEHRGPPVPAAFDEQGQPTKAALGFARKHGVEVADLERREQGKAEYLFHVEHRPGRGTPALLPALVERALRDLPARKRMSWGLPGVTFPRPVHWAVLLFGEQVVEAELLGVTTGRWTHGHRFHHPEAIALARPGDYAAQLRDPGWVIADFDARRDAIREQVAAAAQAAGGEADLDDELLDEVAALVEWPVALRARFDQRFLRVPPEALVAVMKDHQRYFPVYDAAGGLLPVFVTVSNIASRDPEVVRAGNERVIAPRFADAEFFWDQDRQAGLAAFHAALDHDEVEVGVNAGLRAMVFHPKLGTTGEKVARVRDAVGSLAPAFGADPAAATRAARLAKFDLLTQMVGEFPELQGIMGAYYVTEAGVQGAEKVAPAIRDQYRPAFAGDDIPNTPEGCALAVADRLDTLVGLFAIGQPPTGDKDPFALRRAALGTLRILIEGGHEDVDLVTALQASAASFPQPVEAGAAVEPVFDFMLDRLRVYYLDQGIAPDVIEAVRARRPQRPLDFDRRLQALAAFRAEGDAAAVIEANKRIRNILRKADEAATELDAQALIEPAERELVAQVEAAAGELEPLLADGDYAAALARLGALAGPLDAFFDAVMVMSDDAALRANRLALLGRTRELFLRVADLSRLQGD